MHSSMSRRAASMTRNSLDNGQTAALREKKWTDICQGQRGCSHHCGPGEHGHGGDCSFIACTLGALPPLQKEPQLHLGVQPLSQHAHCEGKSYHCAPLPLATGWLA